MHPDDPAKADVLAAIVEAIADLDAELADPRGEGPPRTRPVTAVKRRARSTRRRQDAPDLPRVASTGATVGRVYTPPAGSRHAGKTFRPSLFLTVTLDSYGPVRDDGTPVDPATYDYVRAARDALHFGKALDRLIQNLRRVAGYDLQYFAVVEPQKPRSHRTRTSRSAAPSPARSSSRSSPPPTPTSGGPPPARPSTTRCTGRSGTPPRRRHTGHPGRRVRRPRHPPARCRPGREALDELDHEHATAAETGEPVEPTHCVRFGRQVDVKGVLAGTPAAEKTHRLPRQVPDEGPRRRPRRPATTTTRPGPGTAG